MRKSATTFGNKNLLFKPKLEDDPSIISSKNKEIEMLNQIIKDNEEKMNQKIFAFRKKMSEYKKLFNEKLNEKS